MDEQKSARQALSIIQQSITEYMRYLKQQLQVALMKKDIKSAEGIETILSRIEEVPDKYVIVHVAEGDEQDFRNMLAEGKASYIYVNAPYMEEYNGSWIIPAAEYEELYKQFHFRRRQETRQIMLDEDIEMPDQTHILHLFSSISLAEKQADEYGDEDAKSYLTTLMSDLNSFTDNGGNPVVVRIIEGKEQVFAQFLENTDQKYRSIRTIYLPEYTGSYVVTEDLYKQLVNAGLVTLNKDKNHDERDLADTVGDEPEDYEQEEEQELENEETESTQNTDKQDEGHQKKQAKKDTQQDEQKQTSEQYQEPVIQQESETYETAEPEVEQEQTEYTEESQQVAEPPAEDQNDIEYTSSETDDQSYNAEPTVSEQSYEKSTSAPDSNYTIEAISETVPKAAQTAIQNENDTQQSIESNEYQTSNAKLQTDAQHYETSDITNQTNPHSEHPQSTPVTDDHQPADTQENTVQPDYKETEKEEQPNYQPQTEYQQQTANQSQTGHGSVPAATADSPVHTDRSRSSYEENNTFSNTSFNQTDQENYRYALDNHHTEENYEKYDSEQHHKRSTQTDEVKNEKIYEKYENEKITEDPSNPSSPESQTDYENNYRKKEVEEYSSTSPLTSHVNRDQTDTSPAFRAIQNTSDIGSNRQSDDVGHGGRAAAESFFQDTQSQMGVGSNNRKIENREKDYTSPLTSHVDHKSSDTQQPFRASQDIRSLGSNHQSDDVGHGGRATAESFFQDTQSQMGIGSNDRKNHVKGNTKVGETILDSKITRSQKEKHDQKNPGEKPLIEHDKLTKPVFIGHHDMFEKTAFKAAFNNINETDMYRSTEVFRHEGLINTLRAANGLAVTTMLNEDVSKLTSSLDKTQLGMLSKLVSKNNCGTFDLEDPLKYSDSMKALHKYMERAGILEKRSVSNGGAMMYSLDENGKIYEGNIFDRKAAKRKDKAVDQKMQQEANKLRQQEKLDRKAGKLVGSDTIDVHKAAQDKLKKVKKITKKNKERSLEILKKDLGRAGLDENQAAAILDVLYKNNKKFAATSRVMSIAEKGKSKILTLNPLKNSLTAKSIKEDANARYIYRVQSFMAGTESFYHAGTMIAKTVHNKQLASVARSLNTVDSKLARTGLTASQKARLNQRAQALKQKQGKLQESGKKWASRQKRFEKGIKKAENTFVKKPKELLKKPFKKLGRESNKLGAHIPGFNRMANFRWATFAQKHVFMGKIVSAPFAAYSKVMGFIASKFLMPLLAIIGHILIFMLGISVIGGTVVAASLMISSLFTNEPGMSDAVSADEIMATTMGLVYNELQIEETSWVTGLMHSADGETIHMADIHYSKIDEGSGTIDTQYHDIDAATYIQDILGLQYDASTDTIITPKPWVGAPAEACHTADGNITGGVELRFIGLGGYPAYTSNIMELIAMASVASDDSTLSEYSDDTLNDAADSGLIGTISSWASNIVKGFKFIANTASNFANKIVAAIPGGDTFMANHSAKKRAKVFFSYAKPLFNLSHQTAYGLEFSFLPTDRTLGFSGANTLNQFYQMMWNGEGSGTSLEEAVDAEVPRQVWTFLKQHGFSDIHAAGIMGNFYQESRFNVNCEEYPGQRKGGIGLGQWTGLTANNNRRLRLENYAAMMTGSSEGWRNNVELQMTYLMIGDEPATVRNYLSQNFSSVGEATYWWGDKWERFNKADGSMAKTRIPAAMKYYSLYADKTTFDDGNSSETNTENSNNSTSDINNNGTSNTQKTTVKYSHTPNIDDEGNARHTYGRNLQYQSSVKIENAKSIKVEVWYNTEPDYDWLNIRGQEQGPLSNWDDGNKMYTGGNKSEKPADDSEYHKILIFDGDTAFFAFKSDRSVGRYGYYAIVTANEMNADISWLDAQNAATASMPNILINTNVCSGHNGHGCQSYSHFGYGDKSRLYLEYNGTRIDTIYPAALDPAVSNGEVACSVPSGSGADFYTAIDHNPDCWVGTLQSTYTSSGHGLHTREQSSYFDDKTKYGYEVTSGNPHQFSVTITIDEWTEHDDDGDSETYHTNQYWVFTHRCNQQHTGYYCGGHLRLIIYGIIYHMTPEERANSHDLYTNKTDIDTYKQGYPSGHFTSEDALVNKVKTKAAKDLFDLDMAIYHVNGSVSKEFPGWSYDYIDAAALKLEGDWNEMYGIKASWTINGINAGGTIGSTLLSNTDVANILANARNQYPHDNTDEVRDKAIQTAMEYVGKIGYSQAHHSDPLRVGGYSDCSGYVSQVYHDVLRQVYNTDGFEALAKKYKAYRKFTDGNCKPGDILLHGMDTPEHNDNHALLYVGIVNGTVQSIDCSSSGGVGSVFYRSRGSAYYNGCTYIDMTVFINGYLADHPDMKGNVYPDTNKNHTN